MADVVVLLVDGLSPKVGELFVALNSMNIANGNYCICNSASS